MSKGTGACPEIPRTTRYPSRQSDLRRLLRDGCNWLSDEKMKHLSQYGRKELDVSFTEQICSLHQIIVTLSHLPTSRVLPRFLSLKLEFAVDNLLSSRDHPRVVSRNYSGRE